MGTGPDTYLFFFSSDLASWYIVQASVELVIGHLTSGSWMQGLQVYATLSDHCFFFSLGSSLSATGLCFS